MCAPSAGAGDGTARLSADANERREQLDAPETGLVDLGRRALGDDLRVGVHGLALLHAAARNAGRLEPLDPLVRPSASANAARDPCGQLLLGSEDRRLVGDEVGRVDRRVVEAEERRGTPAAARG